ncbi:UDENN domain-containing protein [Entamoeba marina]
MSISSATDSWYSFSNSSPVLTNKKRKQGNTPTKKLKDKFICKDIYEHWGMIWYKFYQSIMTFKPSLISSVNWHYKKKIAIDSKFISKITLSTQPDHSSKSIELLWESTTPNRHTIMEVLKFGMNQYFRLLPLEESIKKQKTSEKTTYVPTRFLFCYGKYVCDNNEIEDVVFSIHFPFFIEDVGGYRASLIATFCFNFPVLPVPLIKNHFFFDVLYDTINHLIYNFYVEHFNSSNALSKLESDMFDVIDSIEKTLESISFPKPEISSIESNLPPVSRFHQFKDDTSFIASAISAHIQTYTTICITTNSVCAASLMHLLEPFNTPIHLGHYYPTFYYPIVLEKAIPLFSIVFTPELPISSYINFPFPFCIINPTIRSVKICSALSLPTHFQHREQQLTYEMMKTLKFNVFKHVMKIAFVPKGNYEAIIRNARLSTYAIKQINGLTKLSYSERKILLLRFSEELGLKGSIFMNSVMFSGIHLDNNVEWIRNFQDIFNCDLEGLTLILSSIKLIHPVLIPKILWMLQRYEDSVKINFM